MQWLIVVAKAEDTAVVPDALPVLAESGKFAVGGIVPNLMGAVEASGKGAEGKKGEVRVLGLSLHATLLNCAHRYAYNCLPSADHKCHR